ncbi:MAG: hypothetical protein J6P44_00405 [Bacteroidales bacterium]|nr:hypothetical protein [Bacteroidales bacterium]
MQLFIITAVSVVILVLLFCTKGKLSYVFSFLTIILGALFYGTDLYYFQLTQTDSWFQRLIADLGSVNTKIISFISLLLIVAGLIKWVNPDKSIRNMIKRRR